MEEIFLDQYINCDENEIITKLDKNSIQAKELFKKSFLKIGDKYFVTLRLFWKCFGSGKSWGTFRFETYQKIISKKFPYLTINVEVENKRFLLIELPDLENQEFKLHLLGLEYKCKRSIVLKIRIPNYLSSYLYLIEKPIFSAEYFDFYKFVENSLTTGNLNLYFPFNKEFVKKTITVFRKEYEVLSKISEFVNADKSLIISGLFWSYLKDKHPEEINKILNKMEVQNGDMLFTTKYAEGGWTESV